jgi:hypothetical protein
MPDASVIYQAVYPDGSVSFLLSHKSGLGYETKARNNVCLTMKRGRQWRRNR